MGQQELRGVLVLDTCSSVGVENRRPRVTRQRKGQVMCACFSGKAVEINSRRA